ncbi:hypothetical protein F4054_10205 [Candidatus Poribacteria bacterium]|nr:hypothetical protein [Candidatus Poribacteria bacterium]MYG08611.1 hypothetical protein [Candidatus Poribacteria bacterium]MYK22618.1 hypothetical protein [Candidatus Poribacteria bacterium]
MMKTLFFAIVGLLCLSTVATAELSVEDLEKIRQIVNEAEVRLEKRITETEVRLEKRITETEERFTERFTEQSKRLDFHGTLIITLIGALIAFVGVPLALIAYQQNRRTQQEDTIKAQAIEIQALREKIESLEKLLS